MTVISPRAVRVPAGWSARAACRTPTALAIACASLAATATLVLAGWFAFVLAVVSVADDPEFTMSAGSALIGLAVVLPHALTTGAGWAAAELTARRRRSGLALTVVVGLIVGCEGGWLLSRGELGGLRLVVALLVTGCGILTTLTPLFALCFPQPRRP